MAAQPFPHKNLRGLYRPLPLCPQPGKGSRFRMAGLALVMFVTLFAFGGQLLGWHDVHGSIQLGLFMAFLFGIICGYRANRV